VEKRARGVVFLEPGVENDDRDAIFPMFDRIRLGRLQRIGRRRGNERVRAHRVSPRVE
jgi:hypothetical protein